MLFDFQMVIRNEIFLFNCASTPHVERLKLF